MIYINLTE